ncbi:MAG: hypothetical protein J5640_01215 [Bacteroidales bacterium]|nr:hypothetical protein [Bacteroidales bacterium]
MKTLFKIALIAGVAIASAACNDLIEKSQIPQGGQITLIATREGVSPDTKTVRLSDGSVWWNPAEEVSVFYGSGRDGGSKFVSKNTDIAATAELTGDISMTGTVANFWAVYPYDATSYCDGESITTTIPDRQEAVEGNFSGNVFPAMATSETTTLSFYNLCGGLKFFVSRSDIKSLTIKSDGGEALAGTVRFAFGPDGVPAISQVVDAKSEVTLTAPGGGTFAVGKYYYVTLLPGTVSGLWLTLSTASEDGVIYINSSRTIKRSVFGVLKNLDASVTEWNSNKPQTSLKDFAVEFVKGLDVWESTVGTVESESQHLIERGTAWQNVHFIPIVPNPNCEYLSNAGNQYDPQYTPWVLNVGGQEISSSQAWEIAIRGLMNMCTAEGEAFLADMTDRNKPYTLQDGLSLTAAPISEPSASNKWGKHPWYEGSNDERIKYNGSEIESVDINFIIKVGAWHVVRSFISNAGNSPLGMIGNFQQFGTSSSTLKLEGYEGLIAPMREMLVMMRIYKYLLDNNIDSNVYTAIKDQKFSFDLYGEQPAPPGPQPTVTPFKTQWDFCAASALDETTGYVSTFGGAPKYDATGAFDGAESIRDNTAGDGGRYVDANKLGSGRITFVQIDKTAMDTDPESPIAGRNVGSTGHPYQTGTWKGDYWLITATNGNEQPAGAKAHIKFITRSSKTGVKYWIAEYFDGNDWQPAPLEVPEEGFTYAEPQTKTVESDEFTYNVVMKTDGKKNTTVESTFTLAANLTILQFRLRAVGLYKAQDDAAMTALSGCTSRIAGSTEKDGVTTSPVFEVIE